MGLDDLKEVIKKLQGRITNHKDYLQKEPRTRTLLVDPLLRELSWDVEDPNLVELEYEPESSKRMLADYILKNGNDNIAIVEAKPMGKTIEDLGVLEQAEKYASSAGAPFIILTNGAKWLLYERSSTASLASLNPIVGFDIEHDEPYYCASVCVSMWLPNLSSGSPKKAVIPVPAAPALPAVVPKSEGGRKPPTRLVVTMPNGENIAHNTAKVTFVEVIDKLGVEQVKNLNKICNNSDLISNTRNPKYSDSDQPQLGDYYIMTATSTDDKKDLLEEIASDLGVPLKVEIVQKG